MRIAGRDIGPSSPPYIIAEIGANHGGDLGRALRSIDAAKAVGADAVKFQAYTADTITLDCDHPSFTIKDGPWQGRRLYDLYKQCETPFEWFPMIAEHAKKLDITWFASAFDYSAVEMLDGLGVAAIKIASFELIDIPLIRYAASTHRPMILSTGMANDNEVREAAVAAGGNHALLYCISGYPAPASEANLWRLRMRGDGHVFGISDHTLGTEVPIAATALGANIIEKHFTVSRLWKTADMMFSLEPPEFKRMVDAVRLTWAACLPSTAMSEEPQRPLRRSLYVVEDMRVGELFNPCNVRSIRPGDGLPPVSINLIIGKHATRDIARGTPLTRDMVSE